MNGYSLNSRKVAASTNEWLEKRGVKRRDIADLVLWAQKSYYADLSVQECEAAVDKVLQKREVQNAILTGIQLDILSEEKKLFSPLQEMIENDEKLYGCDEILALSIVNVYGSIGLTNFGYIDKVKPGILTKLNSKTDGELHTFLDDLVGAVAAAAASYIAHRKQAAAEEKVDLLRD
ncbi:phosphatidylglycerophosphatase A [Gorillibacterium massiliense]|uniref:phosphatidylglycerophosphatase A family protein n=1 Tax=Gorillibacterium massiliense TaxID=1280390 RepID=UPI0004ADA348|nr:phosphatidylglycerophosphatase A [Gorillibacterium massiliense]